MMSISVQISTMLRSECGGASAFCMSASTVGAALQQLEQNHAALYHCICDETGRVRRHINLFVNTDLVCKGEGLDIVLKSGDVLAIMTAVSGG